MSGDGARVAYPLFPEADGGANPTSPLQYCYQYEIRQKEAIKNPRVSLYSLDGCKVVPITYRIARKIILQYEWLGSMGRSIAYYGLLTSQLEIIGVSVFGWPGGVESRDICGKIYRNLAVCLERGACVHWAPKNAASYLISHSTKQAAKDFGYRIFYAYADPSAGELGTVYQASNWFYIGQGVGRTPGRKREWFIKNGKKVSDRWLRHNNITKNEMIKNGWEILLIPPKHKYIWFEGSKLEKKHFLSSLRYPILPYPKIRWEKDL